METQTVKRPTIPAEFYQLSMLGSIGFILYAIALYTLPASLSYFIATSMVALPLKIILIVPLTIIAGYGVQMLGTIGHEGFHLSLHKNKLVSILIGLFFSSCVIGYLDMGVMMRHWMHHRYTNQPSDPEIQIQKPLKTWWQRLLFSRLFLNFHDAKTTFSLALGHDWPYPYLMPIKLATARNLSWINIVFSGFWIGIYLAIFWYAPLVGLYCIVLPLMAALVVSGCQTFIDHGGISDDPFHNSWSRTSPFMTFLFANTNYHLEHHLYPGVPCYHLPKVHQYLKESGIYEQTQATIEPSFFRAYRHLAAEYKAGNEDSSFDPFKLATNSGISNT